MNGVSVYEWINPAHDNTQRQNILNPMNIIQDQWLTLLGQLLAHQELLCFKKLFLFFVFLFVLGFFCAIKFWVSSVCTRLSTKARTPNIILNSRQSALLSLTHSPTSKTTVTKASADRTRSRRNIAYPLSTIVLGKILTQKLQK